MYGAQQTLRYAYRIQSVIDGKPDKSPYTVYPVKRNCTRRIYGYTAPTILWLRFRYDHFIDHISEEHRQRLSESIKQTTPAPCEERPPTSYETSVTTNFVRNWNEGMLPQGTATSGTATNKSRHRRPHLTSTPRQHGVGDCRRNRFLPRTMWKIDTWFWNNEQESARKSARELKLGFYEKYIKDEQYLIMGILAYSENVEGGFWKYNNQKQFASIRNDDQSGKLFSETLVGVELSKKHILATPCTYR